MTRTIPTLAAALLAIAAPLAAQADASPPLVAVPGLTGVFVDSNSVARTADGALRLTWMRQSDTAVRIVSEEMDCAHGRVRARISYGLVTEEPIHIELASDAAGGHSWQAPAADEQPVVTAACAWLPHAFPAPQAAPATEPELANYDDIVRGMPDVYPPSMRQRGVPGGAVLAIHVLADGTADPAGIYPLASTRRGFARGALILAARMRFTPATRNGRPVSAWIVQPVSFTPPK
ncbi:MAG: TonB family protein [Gemmatimonadetes bacterium]|nr:TonB family protein [Gemmatimonadota bacterium]